MTDPDRATSAAQTIGGSAHDRLICSTRAAPTAAPQTASAGRATAAGSQGMAAATPATNGTSGAGRASTGNGTNGRGGAAGPAPVGRGGHGRSRAAGNAFSADAPLPSNRTRYVSPGSAAVTVPTLSRSAGVTRSPTANRRAAGPSAAGGVTGPATSISSRSASAPRAVRKSSSPAFSPPGPCGSRTARTTAPAAASASARCHSASRTAGLSARSES
nr:hypothetical protein [Urbifossiella limnaea]